MSIPPDTFDEWESSFGGKTAMGVLSPQTWLSGAVHVVRGAPPPGGEVQTGRLDAHQIIVQTTRSAFVRERIGGGPVLLEGVQTRGFTLLGPAELNRGDVWTTWEGDLSFISLAVHPRLLASVAESAGLDPSRIEVVACYDAPDGDAAIERLAHLLGAEAEAEGHGLGRLYAENLLHALAAHLLRRYTAAPGAMVPRGGLTLARRARVEAYVRAHLASSLSLDDLAGAAGLSPFHFARAFRQTTGQTPFAFVRALRMETAARLLCERPHWAVMAVALAVGYESPTSFAAAFRAHWGASPSAYRRDRA